MLKILPIIPSRTSQSITSYFILISKHIIAMCFISSSIDIQRNTYLTHICCSYDA